MLMSRSTTYAFALALVLGTALPATAEDCVSGAGTKAPAGTLASPAAPCPPASRKPAPQPREAVKKPTVQDGRSTIYFGGSFGTDFGVRR
jgi:hypothetical protein